MTVTFEEYLAQNNIDNFEYESFETSEWTAYDKPDMRNFMTFSEYDDIVKMAMHKKSVNETVDKVVSQLPGVNDDTKKKVKETVNRIADCGMSHSDIMDRFKHKRPSEINTKDLKDLAEFGKKMCPSPNSVSEIESVLVSIGQNDKAYEHIVSNAVKKGESWSEWAYRWASSIGNLVASWGSTLWNWLKSNWIYLSGAVLLIVMILCYTGNALAGGILTPVCNVLQPIAQFCDRYIQSMAYSNTEFVVPVKYNIFSRWFQASMTTHSAVGAVGTGVASYAPCAAIVGWTSWSGPAALLAGVVCVVGSSTTGATLTSTGYTWAYKSTYLGYERMALQTLTGPPLLIMLRRSLLRLGKVTGLWGTRDVELYLQNMQNIGNLMSSVDKINSSVKRELFNQFAKNSIGMIDPEGKFNEWVDMVYRDEKSREERAKRRIDVLQKQKDIQMDEAMRRRIQKDIESAKMESPNVKVKKTIISNLKDVIVNARINKAARGFNRSQGGLEDGEVTLLLEIFGVVRDPTEEEKVRMIESGMHRELLASYMNMSGSIYANMPKYKF
jgi:hypothetical protein